MDERRKFSRILFGAQAHLTQDDNRWTTRILDLSLNGALIEEPAHFRPGDASLELDFLLPNSNIELKMEAELVHRKKGLLGLKCIFIDIDSISHLRRMLELNLGDSSLLNRELSRFIEVHDSQGNR